MALFQHSYIYHSLKGITKKQNEDNCLAINVDSYSLFAIFDGVGSALNCKRATILAKDFINENHNHFLSDNVSLDKMMYECNNYIIQKGLPEAFTTYCIVFIPKKDSNIFFSHMGDSRIYSITNQYIDQITIDDKVGFKNIITKCLGMDRLSRYDFQQFSLNAEQENLLLCTDGFYSFLEEKRMRFFQIFGKKSMRSISDDLLSLVKNKNTDDATYILIR